MTDEATETYAWQIRRDYERHIEYLMEALKNSQANEQKSREQANYLIGVVADDRFANHRIQSMEIKLKTATRKLERSQNARELAEYELATTRRVVGHLREHIAGMPTRVNDQRRRIRELERLVPSPTGTAAPQPTESPQFVESASVDELAVLLAKMKRRAVVVALGNDAASTLK